MTITVTDFERITGISRHTVYSWIYRDKMPSGITKVETIGKTKLIKITKESEYFKKVSKQLV
jgi:hypothetical protein